MALSIDDYPFAFDPDPARFDYEISQLIKGDTVKMPRVGAIVAVGSSTMRVWHPRIEADLDGLTIIPRGFGGSQFSDAIFFADQIILPYRPRAVLVYEGDNDIANGKSPERVLGEIQFMVGYCRSTLPDLRFYVVSIKPSIARADHWPAMVEANAMMKEWCAATDGVTYIDAATPLLDEFGQLRTDIYLDDNLHLNDHGYDLWAAAIAPVLQKNELYFE